MCTHATRFLVLLLALAFAATAHADLTVTRIYDGEATGPVGYCIAADADDNLYVSYALSQTIAKISDPGSPNPTVEPQWGGTPGLLLFPGLAVSDSGYVYVAGYQGVFRIPPTGGFGTAILSNSPTTPFETGKGLRIGSDGNIYAVAHDSGTAYRIPPGYGATTQILGPADGILPNDLAFDLDGSVFVGGNKIIRVSSSGQKTIVPYTPSEVEGLEVDSNGRLWVAEAVAHRVVRLTAAGGDWSTLAGPPEVLLDSSTIDGAGNPFLGPFNSMMDSQDNFYVIAMGDDVRSSAWRIDPNGGVTELINETGDGEWAFRYGLGIGIDSRGNSYVTSEELHTQPPDLPDAADVFRMCEDTDGDGACDGNDNCTEVANVNQVDADGDGYGNACDADFNQDGIFGLPDWPTFFVCIGQQVPGSGTPDDPDCSESDFNGDGVVGVPDYALLPPFGTAPGPSGLDCVTSPPTNGSCE